jgi:hypothetical protein
MKVTYTSFIGPFAKLTRRAENDVCSTQMEGIFLKRSRDIYSIHQYTSSTTQGGGGSFKPGKPKKERLVVVNHRWQSESTDGLKGGWRKRSEN